jgi:hypothetical protein
LVQAFSSLEGGYTPTSGITGVLIALNLCRKVNIYGMQVSEAQGYPYHYHNRCPQPHGVRPRPPPRNLWVLLPMLLMLLLSV